VQEMLGYSKSEIVGMPIENIMSDLSHNEKIVQTGKLMAGATINFETVFYRKDKSTFPVEVTASIISLGDQLMILGIDRDISERKRSEQIIKESEQKLLNIFNSSTDGIIITDFNLKILAVNDTLIRMVGFDGADYLNIDPYQLILPEYIDLIKNRVSLLQSGEKSINQDIEVYHKNGNVLPIEVNSKVIIHEGKPCLLNILRDTTERRNMEKKLFETIISTEEKEREHFAGDLHDEVGPLLSSLKMYISLLSETEDKKKKDYIIPQIQTLIKEAITTIREISNDLSPHVLNNYGCVAAINSFLSLKRDFLNISFNQNLENKRFETSTEIVLYRIVKELVNNTIKHAKASGVNIILFEEESVIRLKYTDNGVGFDIDSTFGNTAGSIGLLNIMSRIKSVNGKYKINTAKGSGFDFELVISINK
jgi:PAS domain S-box-containing protein